MTSISGRTSARSFRAKRLDSARRAFGEARHLSSEGEAGREASLPSAAAQVARLYTRHESSAAYVAVARRRRALPGVDGAPDPSRGLFVVPEEPSPLRTADLSAHACGRHPGSSSRAGGGGQTFATAMAGGGSAQARLGTCSAGSGEKPRGSSARLPRSRKRSICGRL